jgi:hypothetical protein
MRNFGEGNMELTAEQDAKFKELCSVIKLGEYGRVEVSFIGEPSNTVQIKAEKTVRFHNEKIEPLRENRAGKA